MTGELAHRYARETYDFWALNDDEDGGFGRPLWSQCTITYQPTQAGFLVTHQDYSPVWVREDGAQLVDCAAYAREHGWRQ
jgi:hypothetical protein